MKKLFFNYESYQRRQVIYHIDSYVFAYYSKFYKKCYNNIYTYFSDQVRIEMNENLIEFDILPKH